MSSFLKNVFVLIGTMMLSLILFALTMGTPGRSAAWSFLEPVFQKQLDRHLFEDQYGEILNQRMSETFNKAVELDREYFNY
mgnify:CR=1 FL=1